VIPNPQYQRHVAIGRCVRSSGVGYVKRISAAEWLVWSIAVRTMLLLLSLFPSVLRCLMMTNDAASASAENAVMAGKVASDSPDGRAL
jgi:hypothetical protein